MERFLDDLPHLINHYNFFRNSAKCKQKGYNIKSFDTITYMSAADMILVALTVSKPANYDDFSTYETSCVKALTSLIQNVEYKTHFQENKTLLQIIHPREDVDRLSLEIQEKMQNDSYNARGYVFDMTKTNGEKILENLLELDEVITGVQKTRSNYEKKTEILDGIIIKNNNTSSICTAINYLDALMTIIIKKIITKHSDAYNNPSVEEEFLKFNEFIESNGDILSSIVYRDYYMQTSSNKLIDKYMQYCVYLYYKGYSSLGSLVLISAIIYCHNDILRQYYKFEQIQEFEFTHLFGTLAHFIVPANNEILLIDVANYSVSSDTTVIKNDTTNELESNIIAKLKKQYENTITEMTKNDFILGITRYNAHAMNIVGLCFNTDTPMLMISDSVDIDEEFKNCNATQTIHKFEKFPVLKDERPNTISINSVLAVSDPPKKIKGGNKSTAMIICLVFSSLVLVSLIIVAIIYITGKNSNVINENFTE